MNKVHRLILKIFLIIVTFISVFLSSSGAVMSCNYLSKVAILHISDEYKGWKVLDLSDLVPDDRNLWNRYHPGKCPGVARGDILGRGQQQYAVALISTNGKMEKLIFLRQKYHSYSSIVISGPSTISYPMVVWSVGPGIYKDEYSGKRYKISNQSIIYEAMESHATQYYYSGGKFRSLVASY